jgi:hypothetical protein
MKNQAVPKTAATQNPTIDWSFLLTSAPHVIWRHRWDEYAHSLGLPYSRGTMQNRDSAGTGPVKVAYGTWVGYTREALVEWLTRTGMAAAGRSQSSTSRS